MSHVIEIERFTEDGIEYRRQACSCGWKGQAYSEYNNLMHSLLNEQKWNHMKRVSYEDIDGGYDGGE